MSISSINGNFITSLTGIQTNSSSRASVFKAGTNKSQSSDSANRLRSTANTFAEALDRINSVGGYLHVSENTLLKLEEIIDKALVLADKSTKHDTSDSKRAQLDREFKKLGTEFNKLVEDANIDGTDLLSTEGISAVFELAGLTTEQSASLAKIFKEFIIPTEEDTLASQQIKGKTPPIPNAVQPPTPVENYTRTMISNNTAGTSPTAVFTSSVNTVFIDDQDPTNQNAGNDNAVIVSTLGDSQSIVSVNSDVTLLSTSETTGYSLIKSNQDFLGTNAAGVNQLFLVNNNGSVIHQYTEFTSSVNIESGDISSDGSEVVFVSNGDLTGINSDASDEVFRIHNDPADLGFSTGGTLTQISSLIAGGNISNAVRISEDGSTAAYDGTGRFTSDNQQLRGYVIYDLISDSEDRANINTRRSQLGFTISNSVVTVAPVTNIVFRQKHGGLAEQVFTGGATSSQFSASEYGHLVYSTTDTKDIRLADITDGAAVSSSLVFDGSTLNSYSKLSVSNDQYGNAKVVVSGILTEQNSLNQVYEFKTNTQNVTDVITPPDTVQKVFDYSLKRRSNAFKVKEDLKAIKNQISNNLSAVRDGLENVRSNLEIVRAVGTSFLEISQKAFDVGDAEKIANNLKNFLLSSRTSSDALAQIENLQSISKATLLAVA
ncbi:MAG: hypothetical protein SGJ02_02260 [bacterium]|nr:hypothetical protein [bacterium]